jgi:hypothetical protein
LEAAVEKMSREKRNKLRQKLNELDVEEALSSLVSDKTTKDITMERV